MKCDAQEIVQAFHKDEQLWQRYGNLIEDTTKKCTVPDQLYFTC
jgi:hypothetical protein